MTNVKQRDAQRYEVSPIVDLLLLAIVCYPHFQHWHKFSIGLLFESQYVIVQIYYFTCQLSKARLSDHKSNGDMLCGWIHTRLVWEVNIKCTHMIYNCVIS